MDLQAPRIKVSGEVVVKWSDLKRNENYLKQSDTVFVSTFIDYYGLMKVTHFPKWKEGAQISEVNNGISFLGKSHERGNCNISQ